jgi:hypothetical protein
MAEGDAMQAAEAGDDLAAVIGHLQDQIDQLTATVEHHQRLWEWARRSGLLPVDVGEPQ